MMAISDAEFASFRALVLQETGIHLSPAKKALLVARLAGRLRATGSPSYRAYLGLAMQEPEELLRLIDCITTNETRFFREPKHFDFLAREVFPAWKQGASAGRRSRRIRAWSAGCSTGQELYSLAMALLDHLGDDGGFSFELLGTDISTRVLDRAAHAIWPIEAAADIPERYLKAFMLKGKGAQEGKMRAGSEIRQIVRFQRLNLIEERYALTGRFDLIFCRNVLIYFQNDTKQRVIERLTRYLAPGGYLLFGHAEGLCSAASQLVRVLPTVYRLPPDAEGEGRRLEAR
ncbi:hypothetical protein BE17_20085 [Sorangium cellulosum]|uniref:protein-glutamate O-methyltransferase n=1 Tax=Sorangium cellulosum TaxID=56 RepID=A0A150RGD1_SORCE|nr:hypothetical protein BE17_20085 [Sorangium cellulosum]